MVLVSYQFLGLTQSMYSLGKDEIAEETFVDAL